MKIDVHGHVTAPDSLYVYKAGLVSHRGAHGRGDAALTAEAVNAAASTSWTWHERRRARFPGRPGRGPGA